MLLLTGLLCEYIHEQEDGDELAAKKRDNPVDLYPMQVEPAKTRTRVNRRVICFQKTDESGSPPFSHKESF